MLVLYGKYGFKKWHHRAKLIIKNSFAEYLPFTLQIYSPFHPTLCPGRLACVDSISGSLTLWFLVGFV